MKRKTKRCLRYIVIFVCLFFLYIESVHANSLVPIIGFWLTAIPLIALEINYKTINEEDENND